METTESVVACSECFADFGLILDARHIGFDSATACPNCGKQNGRKLSKDGLEVLASRFFVWGSLIRLDYGGAPTIQFNDRQKTSINPSPWLKVDLAIFEKQLGVGFFPYGPRLWMVGEIEPLKALQDSDTQGEVIQRIIREYPKRAVETDVTFFRIRKAPMTPAAEHEYDSAPLQNHEPGRFDMEGFPVLYSSPDLAVCIHECRVTAEDDLYVATLGPTRTLTLLDLTVVLEEKTTEFESLDLAVHMLFLAGKHSYPIARRIAQVAQNAGFDGLVYPSYFSLLRAGVMPFQTSYGISHRRVPQFREHEEAKSVPNFALFGRPLQDKKIVVKCINRLVLNRVAYGYHFGPVQS